MGELIETAERRERYVLVGVDREGPEDSHAQVSLNELADLLSTAGGDTAGFVLQKLPAPNKATYVGSGKVDEIRELVEETGADGVICDDELTPSQLSNLQDLLGTRVLDRTVLILDIFAAHAQTAEGKIQVEMAQLRYRSSRLKGLGRVLSRLGGGIGTRGPGETKLESDRRVIRERIGQLGKELDRIEKVREQTRKQRLVNKVPVIAIVGYTNAGKSTLLNHLTEAGVIEEDKLFATLDPTTRARKLPGGSEVLFTDTVGFIHKLPHGLIEAFRSTLEEAKYADIILHVVDASDPEYTLHMKVVYDTLKELGVIGKPIVTAFNKMDLTEPETILRDPQADYVHRISARSEEGVGELLETIEKIVTENTVLLERIFPYQAAGRIQQVRKQGTLLAEEYRDTGIYVKAQVPKALADSIAAELGD